MGGLIFVTGGARSGKSRFAERLAAAEAKRGHPVLYLATMEIGDEELAARVARHRGDRPASWRTVEAPLDPATALRDAPADSCVLLDCVSLWVSNLLLAEFGEDEPSAAPVVAPTAAAAIEQHVGTAIDELLAGVAAREGLTIAVSNEVGGGVVPPSALGRIYRDLLGIANQRVGGAADRAWLLVAGRALELPPTDER
jgi:adenosyl cobinamide kinase/adenosyl cobinamide phosphate guanylyltransferase